MSIYNESKKRKREKNQKINKKKDDELELPYLPVEIWIKIASYGSLQLWHDMALAIPGLGRYSLQFHVQERMKAKFVKKMETLWYGGKRVYWLLPNGKLHSPNDNQPAYISYDICGLKIYEWWYKYGKTQNHKENDESINIGYYENGSKKYERWCMDGKMHGLVENQLSGMAHHVCF